MEPRSTPIQQPFFKLSSRECVWEQVLSNIEAVLRDADVDVLVLFHYLADRHLFDQSKAFTLVSAKEKLWLYRRSGQGRP